MSASRRSRTFSSRGHTIAPIINPTELIVSSSSRDTVQKRLVIRNPLKHELFVKLILSKGSESYIKLEKTGLLIPAQGIVRLPILIQMNQLGMTSRYGNQLKGYIRIFDKNKETELRHWMSNDKTEKRHELAFTLNFRFVNVFSAVETVLDLPGTARIEEPRQGVSGLDDINTKTAIDIEADCHTARDCGSIMEYMHELKAHRKAKKEANWDIYNMASSVAETVKSWYKPDKKRQFPEQQRSSQRSSKSSKRQIKSKSIVSKTNDDRVKSWSVEMVSEYVNCDMNATPCGGN